jgi:hypothetical protein
MNPRCLFYLTVLAGIALAAPGAPTPPGHAEYNEPLQLLIAPESIIVQAGQPADITITLTNQGPEMLKVLSHIAAHETHLDPFQAQLEPATLCPLPTSLSDDPVSRTIGFTDERDKSAPVIKNLRHGDFIRHQIDLQAWAQRKVNGGKPIKPGCYNLVMSYTVRDQEEVWNGTVYSPEVKLFVQSLPK